MSSRTPPEIDVSGDLPANPTPRDIVERIDRLALCRELATYRHKNPGALARHAIAQAARWLGDTFHDRTRRLAEQMVGEDIEGAKLLAGLPLTKTTKRALRLARWWARRLIPLAFQKARAMAEENEREWARLLDRHRAAARDFAQGQVKPSLQPTDEDIEALALRLSVEAMGSGTVSDTDLEAESAGNPLLRASMREHDEWFERLHAGEAVAGRQNEVAWARDFARHWPAVRHAWEFQHAARLGVARASVAVKEDAFGGKGAALLREAVATELEREELRKATGWPWPARHVEEEQDGMAAPVARLLVYLRQRFAPREGAPAQERLEGLAGESPWARLTPSLAASIVAQVLWFDRLRAELARVASSATALVPSVHVGLATMWQANATQKELDLVAAGERLAWLVVDTREGAADLFGAATTLTFQRLIRWIPEQSFRLWQQGRGESRIEIEGGFSALAEAIGAKSKKAAGEVAEALELGQLMRREWMDGSVAGGLWTYVSRAATRDRRAHLTIAPSPMLCPQYANTLPEGASRALVPVPPMLSKFTGGPRNAAPQSALQWLVVHKLVADRKERARDGGVTITQAGWRSMADKVGLPSRMMPEVLELWSNPDKNTGLEGGPFLERIRGDLWTVAASNTYANVRAFLNEQDQLHRVHSKRGKARAASKRSAKPRKAPK